MVELYFADDFDAAYHFIDNVGTVFYFNTDLKRAARSGDRD